jgi:hypothetical protein
MERHAPERGPPTVRAYSTIAAKSRPFGARLGDRLTGDGVDERCA